MDENTAAGSTVPPVAEKATYIGANKIASVADIERKTPMGSGIVEVTFDTGAKEFYTKKTYEAIVTDVASDASIVRRTKFNQMVPAIKALICEYDLKVSEIQPLLQEIAQSIDNNFARATSYAWTKDDAMYVPNTNPLFDRSILEADALIRSIAADTEHGATVAAAQ